MRAIQGLMIRIPVRRLVPARVRLVARLVARLAVWLALWLAGGMGPAAAAERRIALVIGIGAYQAATPLRNPPKDAHAMALSLAGLGFEVDEKLDPDLRGLGRALRAFGVKAQTADVAVVYYAGHGIQFDHENYLIPSDARLERQHDLVYEAMPAQRLMEEASRARSLGIVILDACRNNPFAERLARARSPETDRVGAGLARIDDVPKGTLVAMATRADALAEDGSGDHSPYAQALLTTLAVPGVELGLFFRQVRDAVLAATDGRQEPYTFGSLGAQPFYFHPEPPNRPPRVPPLPPLELKADSGAQPLGIGRVTDPDGDPVTVRITDLPRGGSLRLADRPLLIGDTLTPEQLGILTFTPDSSVAGQAGAFGFTAEDGRGGLTPGHLFLKILPANHPPVVEDERRITAVANPLSIRPPTDPDGDRLTVTVTALPKAGLVRNGEGRPLQAGDRLAPEDLARLTFDPGLAPPGDAGRFAYDVEDGRGGHAEGRLALTVLPPAPAEASPPPPSLAQSLSPPLPPSPEALALPPDSPTLPSLASLKALPGAAPPLGKAVTDTEKGGEHRDCVQCPPLVDLPPDGLPTGPPAGLPTRPPALAIGRRLVSAAEWRACVAGGGCRPLAELAGLGADAPATPLSWNDAQDLLSWLSRTTRRHYRLPTEREWEAALSSGRIETATAGLREWLADCAETGRAARDGDGRTCRRRILRHGIGPAGDAAADRVIEEAGSRFAGNGIRVARDLP